MLTREQIIKNLIDLEPYAFAMSGREMKESLEYAIEVLMNDEDEYKKGFVAGLDRAKQMLEKVNNDYE